MPCCRQHPATDRGRRGEEAVQHGDRVQTRVLPGALRPGLHHADDGRLRAAAGGRCSQWPGAGAGGGLQTMGKKVAVLLPPLPTAQKTVGDIAGFSGDGIVIKCDSN